MPDILNQQLGLTAKLRSKKIITTQTSYRGFTSIDQEIERDIAMQWFSSKKKTSFSQRNFLLQKEKI
jgi:hypothetical protein